MPRPRAAMRKIREALRLCLAEGLSPRQAGIATGLPRSPGPSRTGPRPPRVGAQGRHPRLALDRVPGALPRRLRVHLVHRAVPRLRRTARPRPAPRPPGRREVLRRLRRGHHPDHRSAHRREHAGPALRGDRGRVEPHVRGSAPVPGAAPMARRPRPGLRVLGRCSRDPGPGQPPGRGHPAPPLGADPQRLVRRDGRPLRHGGHPGAPRIAHNLARWTSRIGLGETLLATKTLRRRLFGLRGSPARRAGSGSTWPSAGPGWSAGRPRSPASERYRSSPELHRSASRLRGWREPASERIRELGPAALDRPRDRLSRRTTLPVASSVD